MLTVNHINELSRIIKEIKNIDENKVPHWTSGHRQKLFYHFSDYNTCTRVTVHDTGVSITLVHQLSDSDLVNKFQIYTGTRSGESCINHDRYFSNGVNPLSYNGQKSKEIDKSEYFNQMLINPHIPDYNYIELASYVDLFFINNEINGELCYTISTVDLKRISFKQYW